jgi:2,3-bisphosphoglycerate-dependent phosphoglycerate mutase
MNGAYVVKCLKREPIMEGQLILLRHGESVWNKKNVFTGWVDIPLSTEGIQEAYRAGAKIQNIPIDVVFTSTLVRAQMTVVLSLLNHASGKAPVFLHEEAGKLKDWSGMYSKESQEGTLPVHIAWELNERMYGKLQGLNKAAMAEKFGAEQVHLWRRSYDTAPPEGESLAMTIARSLPYFQKRIVPYLEKGKTVFISAHGNSLRGIRMHLDKLSKDEVVNLEIPTGEVMIYSYKQGQWKKKS